jgi:hypothetical protein
VGSEVLREVWVVQEDRELMHSPSGSRALQRHSGLVKDHAEHCRSGRVSASHACMQSCSARSSRKSASYACMHYTQWQAHLLRGRTLRSMCASARCISCCMCV